MKKPSPIQKIVVAGDVCIDWFAKPVDRKLRLEQSPEDIANWKMKEGLEMFAQAGGAWLLAELVTKAAKCPVVGQEVPKPLESQSCEDVLHSIIELKRFPEKAKSKEQEKDVWRVDRFRGFAGPQSAPTKFWMVPTQDDDADAEMVVLDDVGNGFRSREKEWPAALATKGMAPLVLWKLARPFGKSPLSERLNEQHQSNTIVVLDVDDLRAEGAAISRQLSWERTAGQLMHALVHDPRFGQLRQFPHLVVRLDLEGALYISLPVSEESEVELVYFATGIEGSTHADIPGRMLGLTSVFVARLAAALVGTSRTQWRKAIGEGICDGIAEARRLLAAGFGPAKSKVQHLSDQMPLTAAADKQFKSVVIAPLAGFNDQSRLIDYVPRDPLFTMAAKIVLQGVKAARGDAPVAAFGDLQTLDRTEIEAFRSVGNLIAEYLAQPSPERPLCIAVFGQPGSGKSFGVAQVAKTLADVEKIEFNISQYESPTQLTTAFHTVRDAVVRGKVPLVFFDEFDASVHREKLAWLKHFLAPMQDGKFTDGSLTHHIGRAIFIFAGGTRHSYEQFVEFISEKENSDAKGADFLSRLRGFVNIRGIDRREVNDAMFVIRRAVVLRSLLERKAKGLIDRSGAAMIDEGVLRAYLRCGSFCHGARSMEAIIDMSQLSGREVFERASLPSPEQLNLHVNAKEFMELVELDVKLNEHREEIAKAIHEFFVEQQKKDKPADDPAMQPWNELNENYRDDNRTQADDIPRKLSLVHCAYRPKTAKDGPDLFAFTDAEIEILAENEHERWNEAKRGKGYTYAPVPKHDDPPRTHPCLLPWADLPDKERKKDRDTSRAIPEYLHNAGFTVYRLDSPA